MAKKSPLYDVLVGILHDTIDMFFVSMRENFVTATPSLMKKISHKLVLRYVYFAVFLLAGLLLFGTGLSELITKTGLESWMSYMLVGIVFALVGWIVYQK